MTPKEGMRLPEGTYLKYDLAHGPVYGVLEITDSGTRWIITPRNAGIRIRPASVMDWNRISIISKEEYMLHKLEENKMTTSAVDLLRKYSDIISEADAVDQTNNKEEFPDDPSIQHGKENQFWDDDDLANEDDALASLDNNDKWDNMSDPLTHLASTLENVTDAPAETIKMAVSNWLKQNKYEITPVNGLSNGEGEV